MIDSHPAVVAATERHQLILARLTSLWNEVSELAERLADLRQFREGPDDSIEAETERLLQRLPHTDRLTERRSAEARMSTLRGSIRTLGFAEQKASLAIGVARRAATSDRLRSGDVVQAAREIHAAAQALAEAERRAGELAQRLVAEGVAPERLYWLSRAGWSAADVAAWRTAAESICGEPLSEPA